MSLSREIDKKKPCPRYTKTYIYVIRQNYYWSINAQNFQTLAYPSPLLFHLTVPLKIVSFMNYGLRSFQRCYLIQYGQHIWDLLVSRIPGLVSRIPGLVSRIPGLLSRIPGLVSRIPDWYLGYHGWHLGYQGRYLGYHG